MWLQHHRLIHLLGWVLLLPLIDVVSCVRIRELSVPPLVELGSEDVVLSCDYEYDEREKRQLEVKWYFNGEPTPFFQWLPAKAGPPQIIGDRFRGHLNLSYVSSVDLYRRHSSLLLRRPTLDLSGRYTCKVSTLFDEDVRQKYLKIYSPATFVTFEQRRSHTGQEVNVSCSAHGVFPLPSVKLTWGSYQLDDSDSSVSPVSDPSGTYLVVVHRVVRHSELRSHAPDGGGDDETRFGCELSIPGTDYLVREEAVYRHREPRRHSASRFGSSLASAGAHASAVCVALAAALASLVRGRGFA